MKSIAMLKLKVENPPECLERIAGYVRRGRNAGLENWLLRHRGLPETEKQSDPTVAKRPKGFIGPMELKTDKHPSTKIYHSITTAVPEVSCDVCALLSAEVWSNLNAKLDWRRQDGESSAIRRRRDAILKYEDRPPWFTKNDIPVLNKNSTVEFGNELHLTISNLVRGEEPLRVKLSLKGVPPKLKTLIRRVIAGELKFSDSSIRQKPSGEWYWFWPIKMESRVVLNADVIATLTPVFAKSEEKQSDWPFVVTHPEGKWYIGDGRYLEAQTKRLIGLRKMVGYRYRQGLAKGHGRSKMDTAISHRSTQLRNIRDEFRRRTVLDTIRQCERYNCGTLIYREPTGPAKTKCWFECKGLEFDWTSFLTDLKNSAAKRGINVVVKKLKIKEVLGKDIAA